MIAQLLTPPAGHPPLLPGAAAYAEWRKAQEALGQTSQELEVVQQQLAALQAEEGTAKRLDAPKCVGLLVSEACSLTLTRSCRIPP